MAYYYQTKSGAQPQPQPSYSAPQYSPPRQQQQFSPPDRRQPQTHPSQRQYSYPQPSVTSRPAGQLKPSVSQDDYSGPRVVHLQYNSPLQLYSTPNIEATLEGQTKGSPGYGTLVVQGDGQKQPDITQSHVYRLLQDEKQQSKAPQSARNIAKAGPQDFGGGEVEYHGYRNPTNTSRSFRLLQEMTGTDDYGSSDF